MKSSVIKFKVFLNVLFIIVMFFCFSSKLYAFELYTASPYSTVEGESFWGNSVLKLDLSINGTVGEFTVSSNNAN